MIFDNMIYLNIAIHHKCFYSKVGAIHESPAHVLLQLLIRWFRMCICIPTMKIIDI